MKTVTKKELTDRVADALKIPRTDARSIIQRFFDEVMMELSSGNRCEFRDFGVFEIRIRKPRMAQNPRTLERVPVPMKSTVKFKVGRLMKSRVQKCVEEKLRNQAGRPVQPASASKTSSPPPTT